MKRSTSIPYVFALTLAALCVGASSTADAQMRLRAGGEGGVGAEWGTPRGVSIGAYGQVGLQLNNTFAIFYQPSIIAHALGTNSDANTFVAFGNLAMADLTFGFVQLGFGAGLDVGHVVKCDDNAGTCSRGPNEVNPAIGGRIVGVVRLPHYGVRRRGIPIGLNVHSTFFDNDSRITSFIITAGYQVF